jgi:hypothetical protein
LLWLAPARVRARDPSTLVPVEHWSYALVERLEAAGHLVGTADGIKPYSRRHLARLALRADSVATLTRIDRQRLSLLLRELDPEVRALQSRVAPRPHGLHLQSPAATGPPVQYSADRGGLYVDLLARQQTDVLTGRGRAGSERVYRNRFGGVIRGDLLNDVGFRIAFEQSREQGTGDYDLREDVFERRLEAVQLKGSLADFHAGAAYITFGLGAWVDVQVGKDQVAWGPAPDDNLGLSINAPAFDMIRLRTRLGGLELVSLHGSLATCPERPDSPICGGEADTNASYIVNGMSRLLDRDRWIAAHRVEVAVTPTLDIGFQEVVIYGDRNPEPSYLNPFMFYWAAQSYLGDKDNVMMAIDADWRVRAGLRWWGAYAIDDLKKLKVFSDDFANKFSLQTGILWTDPLGVRDTDLRADYVRVEPWIYTHKFPVNTFRHFDAPLGHSLGPNSDRWRVAVERRWTRDLSTSVSFGRSRHGDNVLRQDGTILNVGGDLHRGWRPGDRRNDKDFLDGNLSVRRLLEAAVDFRLWPRLHLQAGAAVEWGDNVPLPPRDGSATPLTHRSGYGDGRQTHVSLDVRYGVL